MSKWSSNKKDQLIFEGWRRFLNEEKKSKAVDEALADYIPGTSARKMKKAVGAEEEGELATWMKSSLKNLPTPPIDALSPGAKALAKKGDDDGSQDDDKQIKSGVSGDISFTKLKASQSEIGSAQSLRNTMTGADGTEWDGIDWGDPKWLLAQMKSPSPTFTFSNPIVVAQTSDGFVVLDGHHRWSQAMMINPKGKINVVGFNASAISADDVLQALHLGIYAVADQAKIKPAKGTNLLDGGIGEIRGWMDKSERKVDPQTLKPDPKGLPPYVAVIMKLKGITDPKEGVDAAVAYATDAIKTMAKSIVPGSPPRTKMPQTDVGVNPGATPAAVAKQLSTGAVNYAPPYGGQTKPEKKVAESKKRK